MTSFICDICGEGFSLKNYSYGSCPNCGQKYEYEEGIRMVLTEDQINMLKIPNMNHMRSKALELLTKGKIK